VVAELDDLPLGRHVWPEVEKNDNVFFFEDIKTFLLGDLKWVRLLPTGTSRLFRLN
jgi:hypothetical protein